MQLTSTWRLSLIVFAGLATFPSVAKAKDIYVGQTASGANNGQSCSDAFALTFFNAAANWGNGSNQIGSGTTVHLCGTITGTAGSTALTFQASGTSGNPITLLFEPNAVLQAPYWAPSGDGSGCGGAICMYGRNYIIIDGGSNGAIRNTANGDALANQQGSEAIEGFQCSNCTVRNLTIAALFIAGGRGVVDQTRVRAISMSGSNWTVNNNTMHECGWCLFNAYGNGDTNIQIYNNNMYNFDHGWMFATAGAASATNAYFHDNQVHDTAVWDGSGCPYHHDGIHTFGTTGSSMSGLYIYNNYFYGNWGTCPTGFIFIEGGGSSTPSHLQSFAAWNNVAVIPTGAIENTNGWFDFASGESGTQQVFNNTIIGPNPTDNSLCMGLQNLSGLTAVNNAISNCGDPMWISSKIVLVDYNFYGPNNANNAFVWNGSFTGAFSSWKAACQCDAHTIQSGNPRLNSDGSPQSGSPVNGAGQNLTSIAVGSLSSLASDGSKGNTRSPSSRPVSGAWTVGAYNAVGSSRPAPPTNLKAAVSF